MEKKKYTRAELIRFNVSKVLKGRKAQIALEVDLKITKDEWNIAVQELQDYRKSKEDERMRFSPNNGDL